jgi:hypothetical protein
MTQTVAASRRVATRLPAFAGPVAVALAAGAAAAYVGAVDPHEAGHYPTCPSLWLTGWYCPGCGSLRAVHDLVHLDLYGALDMNPFAVIAFGWLVWRWVWWLAGTLGHGRVAKPAPAWALYGLTGLILAFWVLRNVGPLAPILAP